MFWDLAAHRRQNGIEDVAVIRLEQFYPFPTEDVRDVLERYAGITPVVWVQEEPENMGAWSFVQDRLRPLLEPNRALRFWGRRPSAAPAGGSYKRYAAEQETLVRRALEDPAPGNGGA